MVKCVERERKVDREKREREGGVRTSANNKTIAAAAREHESVSSRDRSESREERNASRSHRRMFGTVRAKERKSNEKKIYNIIEP